MMFPRIICLAVLSAIAGTLATTSGAEAGSRWRLRYLNPYYYVYPPRPLDLYSSDYGDEDDFGDDEYLSYYDNPDDGYYVPRYRNDEPGQIAQKKKKTVKAVPATKPVVKKSVAATEKKPVAIASKEILTTTEKKITVATEGSAVVSAEKKVAPVTAGMSCDKAEKIVSGYGFTSVKPTACTGQVFAFNATRSGKAYVIKLSSASGELTEVKKVQ
jgi:hypothetical protein